MGSRRTHELAAVAAARAAYVAGFASTSNLEAGRRYGVPTRGTAAHSFTLLHTSEREAFAAQIAELGAETTLLVDTYDVFEAVKTGVELTTGNWVRSDSTPAILVCWPPRSASCWTPWARSGTKIIVTSDLDEFMLAALMVRPSTAMASAPHLVTGSGHPTCEFVYKLVARAESDEAGRTHGRRGQEEHQQDLCRRSQVRAAAAVRARYGRGGDRWHRCVRRAATPTIVGCSSSWWMAARSSVRNLWKPVESDTKRSRAELPLEALKMSRGEPVIDTIYSSTHAEPTRELRA